VVNQLFFTFLERSTRLRPSITSQVALAWEEYFQNDKRDRKKRTDRLLSPPLRLQNWVHGNFWSRQLLRLAPSEKGQLLRMMEGRHLCRSMQFEWGSRSDCRFGWWVFFVLKHKILCE
jgi:hypothetical protein